jgi:L-2-hydroxyglutarate oxidase LhgO
MDEIECVVIGAGVVGLAIARELAQAGREVLVLEAGDAIGVGTSSRNSEVIHAGLYYPTGSQKATLCVRGRALLYAYCDAQGVPYRRCGKLLVATSPQQIPKLDAIAAQAAANGVDDLQRLSASDARALEPALSCVAALLSPRTGIVDSHQLMLAYQGDAERAGASVVLRTRVRSIRVEDGGFVVEAASGSPDLFQLRARCVVNSAGLYAAEVARRIDGLDPAQVPRIRFARGNYFTVSGRSPFERLIYPMPNEAGLGVHLSVDLGGQAKFGPDVEWLDGGVESIRYDVDPARAQSFYAAIREYWPALPDGALQPGYAGIRPKLTGPGEPAGDFLIQTAETHRLPGLVNLYGIESPGLTASLAIARRVAASLSGGA